MRGIYTRLKLMKSYSAEQLTMAVTAHIANTAVMDTI
jgi:hypothetical protein